MYGKYSVLSSAPCLEGFEPKVRVTEVYLQDRPFSGLKNAYAWFGIVSLDLW